jgi:cell division protein FtsW (lipid II flippase)
MKKYLLIFLFALGLVAFGSQKAKAAVTLVYRSDPLIATRIQYTTGATTPTTIAVTITTIILTATDIGATIVIGTTGMTMMMIKPKPL